jgi:DNA invertase Pin-like site-specific DNA recombinase
MELQVTNLVAPFIPPYVRTHPKIKKEHLNRSAEVYLRQSTLKQVRDNKESQAYQYKLAERAEEFGWTKESIHIIDCDLGKSGASTEHRDGYKSLVADIVLGKVGIIFSYEVSRLSRNNSDWYLLLDLAARARTLIADVNDVYDPSLPSDRLVLGLKGALSEAEIYAIVQRLSEGRMIQVLRGDYQQRLPAGLERLPDGSVLKDPNAQVRETIELVFQKFAEFKSAAKVVRYLNEHQIRLPRRLPQGGIILREANKDMVLDIIKNPAYAGAFVYGRSQTDRISGKRSHPRSIDSEDVYITQDVYPAYITWEQYLRNIRRLEENYAAFIKENAIAIGVPRNGDALLQGIARCGHCGGYMKAYYSNGPRYYCFITTRTREKFDCKSVNGKIVDKFVADALFQAIDVTQLDALEGMLAKKQEERGQVEKHWQQVTAHAEFEARKAQDRYESVDARNRLVAATLETLWEESLQKVEKAHAGYEQFIKQANKEVRLPSLLREQLTDIANSLPQLWAEGKVSPARFKELLRCLISKVILKRIAADELEVRIIWTSGGCWPLKVNIGMRRTSDSPRYAATVERVKELWQQGMTDNEIARQLTAEGYRSPRRDTFLSNTVQGIRLKHDWLITKRQGRRIIAPAGYVLVADLAAKLGVARITINRWIRKGVIRPENVIYERSVYVIKDCPEIYQLNRDDKNTSK